MAARRSRCRTRSRPTRTRSAARAATRSPAASLSTSGRVPSMRSGSPATMCSPTRARVATTRSWVRSTRLGFRSQPTAASPGTAISPGRGHLTLRPESATTPTSCSARSASTAPANCRSCCQFARMTTRSATRPIARRTRPAKRRRSRRTCCSSPHPTAARTGRSPSRSIQARAPGSSPGSQPARAA